jgi:hypothetical protein
MAAEVTERYGREFPDEDERYEPKVWRRGAATTRSTCSCGPTSTRRAPRGWTTRSLAGARPRRARLPAGPAGPHARADADVAAEHDRDDMADRLRAATGVVAAER